MSKSDLVIHPVLLAVYPYLFFFAYNIGRIAPEAFFLPLMVTICAAALAWAVLAIALKNSKRAATVVSLSLLMFFSYSHVYEVVAGMVGSNFALAYISMDTNLILLMIWTAIFLSGFIFFIRTRRKLDGITNFLNLLSVFLILFPLITIGAYEIKMAGARSEEKNIGAKVKRSADIVKNIKGEPIISVNNPNIYYLVVDAYANEDILKEIYGYDNGKFLDFLAEKGFYVANKSYSNYNQTSLSIASTLNLKYLDSILSNVNMKSDNLDLMKRMIKNNEVFKFLKKRGYTIAAFASGRSETEVEKADIYITSGQASDESKSAILNITPIPHVSSTMGEDSRFGAHRKTILYILDHLIDTVKFKRPVFVFAHIELPHPPFVFGPNGEVICVKGRFSDHDGDSLINQGGVTYNEYVKRYVDQVVFLNKKLITTINDILSQPGEKPIIILQSDHGPRARLVWEDPTRTYLKECMSILNAYYFPDSNYKNLYDSITPVNSFRLILSQYYSGTNYGLLKDNSYFSTARYPYKFINVNEKTK